MDKRLIPAHKRLAMGMSEGSGFKGGGSISISAVGSKPLKTGMPLSPQTKAKRDNLVPGMKKGGKC